MLAGTVAFALDGFHSGHLWQRDVTTRGDGAKGIFDAVDFRFPNWLAEPDGESVDFQPAPARGKKVPQFMHKNQQVEEQQHFQDDKYYFQNRHTNQLTTPAIGTALNIAAGERVTRVTSLHRCNPRSRPAAGRAKMTAPCSEYAAGRDL